MKKQILTGILVLGTAVGAFAQGQISIDNINNDPAAANPSSATAGVVYVQSGGSNVLLNQDINIAVLGGATAGSLSLVGALTFANGLAQNDVIANGVPGQFADFNGGVYAVNGVALNGTAFIQLQFWLGTDATFAAALLDGSPTGLTSVYSTVTGGGSVGGAPPNNPVDVGNNMPSVIVTTSPEPTTLALCGLGAASLLLFRRKKS